MKEIFSNLKANYKEEINNLIPSESIKKI